MSKAILVIDIPDSCSECPVCASYQSCAFSIREYWCSTNGKDVEPYSKPDWCPLKPMPDKQRFNGIVDYDNDYLYGWNACINKILSD
jgi:hypothetical protein